MPTQRAHLPCFSLWQFGPGLCDSTRSCVAHPPTLCGLSGSLSEHELFSRRFRRFASSFDKKWVSSHSRHSPSLLSALGVAVGNGTRSWLASVVNAKHSVNVEAQVLALQEEAAAENDYIDRAMQALGMRQHAGKMENVLCIVGKGTRAVSAYLAQKGALTGSTLEASRYLGTRLTRTGTFSYERAVRLHATRAGWLQFGKYWQSRSPFRQRRSLFKGVVQGAALSGLETATGVKGPLTPGEVSPIDRLLVKFGRVLLRGTAKTNAEGGVRAVPNVVIWRRLRLVPTFHELRYRRPIASRFLALVLFHVP